MSVLPFVLAAMTHLLPGHDHSALGGAIAQAVDAELPIFASDESRHRTAALLVAVAFRESTLRADAVGDHGRSFCAFQINASAGGSKELAAKPDECARRGLALLRTSVHSCAAHPVAWYARGPSGCSDARAQQISRDRMNLAASLVRRVAVDS